jgi:very-short-patch-repair endonuclease
MVELAAQQRGIVALWQLRELGFTRGMVQARIERGRLYRVFRGVLSLTPFVAPAGRMMGAALAYGREAALSHQSAAAVWDLSPWPTRVFDVTLARERRTQTGIRLHRARVERVMKDGFPITTVTRTLIDLAAVLPYGRLRDAFERAERLRLLDMNSVTEGMRGRRGARKIRAILGEWLDPEPTRSELEEAFRNLCRDYDIPLPSQNVVVLGYEVDAFWEPDLVVELDGWEWHRTRRAFEADRCKAAALEAAGYRVLRFTWRQIRDERGQVAAAIRSGCPRAGGRGRSPARAAARRSSAPSA